mgnify:FL=1|jgi:hypothetical protein
MIINDQHLKDYQLISKSPKDCRILLFITREEKKAIKSLSGDTGMSMNEILRRSLYNTLNLDLRY